MTFKKSTKNVCQPWRKFVTRIQLFNRSVVLLFYCLLPTANCQLLHSQQLYFSKNTEILYDIDNFLNKPGNNFHTSIHPYFQKDIEKIISFDTIYATRPNRFPKPVGSDNYDFFIQQLKLRHALDITPLYAITPGFDMEKSDFALETNYGLSLKAHQLYLGDHILYFSTDILYDYSNFPDYISSFIDKWKIVPGQGYAYNSDNNRYLYQNSSFYIAHQMPKYFTLEVGFGKNFLGDGYRSLILSQNAYNYPYFKITTNIWKLKYVNLWANFKDIRYSDGNWIDYEDKFGALHFLSWNISKRLNIGLFDAIIWQAKDTLRPRYFDINYLNPVIFYRPVEFSLGSPDNALVGLNLKFLPFKNFVLYSQLLIDDFLIEGLKDDFKKILRPSDTTIKNYGHWMNKQAFQLGFKFYDIFKIKNLDLQTEFNMARPYTYSHRQVLENYGHFNQPLAHPLGTNFWESVSFVRYTYNRWFFETEFMYALVGMDSTDTRTHFGQNIYESTFDTYVSNIDNIPVKQTGNVLLQGVKTNIIFTKLKISYLVNPRNNLRLECGIIYRGEKSSIINNTTNFVFIGISTTLKNYFYDF